LLIHVDYQPMMYNTAILRRLAAPAVCRTVTGHDRRRAAITVIVDLSAVLHYEPVHAIGRANDDSQVSWIASHVVGPSGGWWQQSAPSACLGADRLRLQQKRMMIKRRLWGMLVFNHATLLKQHLLL
jgi:hypothetical protein